MGHLYAGLHMLIVEANDGELSYEYMHRVGDTVPQMAQFWSLIVATS